MFLFLEKYFKSTMYEDYFISTKNKKKLKHFMTKVLYKYGSEKMTNCSELLFLLPFH